MGIDFNRFVENRIKNIKSSDSFAFASAIGVGPWVAPIAPAIIIGYALYKSAPPDMAEFRMITAVAIAIGLVVAGAVSSHNAVTSESQRAWLLVGGYISLEIVGLWLMDVTFGIKIGGTVASLLTLIVYLSRANADKIDTARTEAKEAKQVKIEFQIEQDRLEAEHQREMDRTLAGQKHAEKLARIESKKGVTQGVKMGHLAGSNDPQEGQAEGQMTQANDPLGPKVQQRQRRIAELAGSHTKQEIAAILGVSLSTVKRDFRKLNGYEVPRNDSTPQG